MVGNRANNLGDTTSGRDHMAVLYDIDVDSKDFRSWSSFGLVDQEPAQSECIVSVRSTRALSL
jgi:hypothetical protein